MLRPVPVADLLILSFLFAVVIGGIGWTRLMLWEWQAERG